MSETTRRYERAVRQLARHAPEVVESDEDAKRHLTPRDFAAWSAVYGGATLMDVIGEAGMDRRHVLDDLVEAAFETSNPATLGAWLLMEIRARAVREIRRDVDRELERRSYLPADWRAESIASEYGVATVVTGGVK